ncbi:MAG: class I SAM-dependent methyltransferase [Pseudomonadota bacterium]
MSRLDSFIRRLEAQRACLAHGVALAATVPGPIFELGLGNGRTYDHLRELCPDREIFVFERRVAAHPECVPDQDHLFLGSLDETLPAALGRFAGQVALVHSDLGSGNPSVDRAVSAMVAAHLGRLLAAGGVVMADLDVTFPEAERLALPDGVPPGRYFLYRKN